MSSAGRGTDAVHLIQRKMAGEALTAEEIGLLSAGFISGEIPDYQMSALLMAVCWRGMTTAETLALTRAMVESGEVLDWAGLGRPTVDKHSTGGVGDKTSIVLVPLMAAAGAAFVKMSGRGLGHTGGTLDKLESIPGFIVDLGVVEMQAQVARIGCALVGQSPRLVPADGALYALRDVTGTVESTPLIASSIMSKKIAAGAGSIVLDVKWGGGAFMQTIEEARTLAGAMVGIGEGAGRRTRAVLSPMHEPLGLAVGNALEVREAIETLHGEGPEELWALTVELGIHLLLLSGLAENAEDAGASLHELRDSGAALEKFAELVAAQDGDPRVVSNPALLARAPHIRPLLLDGDVERWVAALDARGVGEVALLLGAGRTRKGASVDPGVGVLLRAKTGDRVGPGEALAEIHAPSEALWEEAAAALRAAYRMVAEPVARPEVSYEVVG